MEPELKDQIKSWEKALSPDVAKRLFIRNSAIEAYKSGEIASATENATKEIIDLMVSHMTKDQIAQHIGNLEKARALLGSLTQGFQVAYAEEKEPEFKAARDKREKEAKAKSSTPKSKRPEDIVAGLGIDYDKMMADINKNDPNRVTAKLGILAPQNTPAPDSSNSENSIPAGQFQCEKCKKIMFNALKSMHKC